MERHSAPQKRVSSLSESGSSLPESIQEVNVSAASLHTQSHSSSGLYRILFFVGSQTLLVLYKTKMSFISAAKTVCSVTRPVHNQDWWVLILPL